MATIKDLKRMCKSFKKCCNNCPLYFDCCGGCITAFPDNADEIVEEWVEVHPIKTYLQDFFEKFPNAPRGAEGSPKICPHQIYPEINVDCRCPEDCLRCWNQEMKEK